MAVAPNAAAPSGGFWVLPMSASLAGAARSAEQPISSSGFTSVNPSSAAGLPRRAEHQRPLLAPSSAAAHPQDRRPALPARLLRWPPLLGICSEGPGSGPLLRICPKVAVPVHLPLGRICTERGHARREKKLCQYGPPHCLKEMEFMFEKSPVSGLSACIPGEDAIGESQPTEPSEPLEEIEPDQFTPNACISGEDAIGEQHTEPSEPLEEIEPDQFTPDAIGESQPTEPGEPLEEIEPDQFTPNACISGEDAIGEQHTEPSQPLEEIEPDQFTPDAIGESQPTKPGEPLDEIEPDQFTPSSNRNKRKGKSSSPYKKGKTLRWMM
ncbi:unnamed protein product [Miscanthus lutarioriparius]|uniref:Uncharacterized protein n=1 Tax=Miscanthus lutarioriparius TaxID=422564 RepID=A0A811RD95_9POAL|nr:unnamed protein product [Miscanthus lutarioriparius]